MQEEFLLLRHEMLINHPGMVQLYGYCCSDGFLGVVYEFKAFESVSNLIPKGIIGFFIKFFFFLRNNFFYLVAPSII